MLNLIMVLYLFLNNLIQIAYTYVTVLFSKLQFTHHYLIMTILLL